MNDSSSNLSSDNELLNKDIFIKYSSIKNKLSSDDDYLRLFKMLKTIDKTIYTSVIDSIVTDSNQIIELIVNDIQSIKVNIVLGSFNTFISAFAYINNGRKFFLSFFFFLPDEAHNNS